MKTFQYLTEPGYRELFLPVVVAGLALAALCAVLSVLVVLKRMAFIGQGISHAAFGGVGLAALIGVIGTAGVSAPGASTGQFFVILGFCLASALLIGWMSDRGGTEPDTAIGIVLVASMALGSILIRLSHSTVEWESFLFGSIIDVTWRDAAIGWGVSLLVMLALWWFRRPLVFWSFDPTVARSLGVRHQWMSLLLMLLLTLATVTAMRLAGVVLATAMLVLPGAIALRLSERWTPVLLLAGGAALAGVLGGLVLSFEADVPPGPAIVVVLAIGFAAARAVQALAQPRGA